MKSTFISVFQVAKKASVLKRIKSISKMDSSNDSKDYPAENEEQICFDPSESKSLSGKWNCNTIYVPIRKILGISGRE